jgi:hypothetical protein
MEKKSLYNLPKDILVELLLKTYDFENLPIEDIYNIKKECQKRINMEKEKKFKILNSIYCLGNIQIRCSNSVIKVIDSSIQREFPLPYLGEKGILELRMFSYYNRLFKIKNGCEIIDEDTDISSLYLHIQEIPYKEEIKNYITETIKTLLETLSTNIGDDKIEKFKIV